MFFSDFGRVKGVDFIGRGGVICIFAEIDFLAAGVDFGPIFLILERPWEPKIQKNHSREGVEKKVDFRDPCFCDFSGFRVAPGSQNLVLPCPFFPSFPRRGVIFF